MRNILITAQKGGVGKTLISDELAYSLDRTQTPYNFYVLDSQGGNRHATAEQDGADISVIDTPGYIQDDLRDMIQDADCIVIPTRPSPTDQPSFMRLREYVQTYAPDTPTVLVVNSWNTFSNSRNFMEWIQGDLKPNERLVSIPQAEAVYQSTGANESVTTFAPRSRVAAQMRTLTNMVRECIGESTESAIQFTPRNK